VVADVRIRVAAHDRLQRREDVVGAEQGDAGESLAEGSLGRVALHRGHPAVGEIVEPPDPRLARPGEDEVARASVGDRVREELLPVRALPERGEHVDLAGPRGPHQLLPRAACLHTELDPERLAEDGQIVRRDALVPVGLHEVVGGPVGLAPHADHGMRPKEVALRLRERGEKARILPDDLRRPREHEEHDGHGGDASDAGHSLSLGLHECRIVADAPGQRTAPSTWSRYPNRKL